MAADFVTGDATGVDLPAHPQALRDDAEAFLTRAFRAFGALSPDNAVTRVTRFEPVSAGNSGQKLVLSVEYARDEPGLASHLFAKFSRDFADPFRDRRRFELEAEIRLATLSRHPQFPIHVARPFFADFNHASGTGLLITECIAFGTPPIEPLWRKCMDHELADPLPYYRATVTAQGQLAAAHKAGRLSPEVEALFPYDAQAAAELPIAHDAAAARAHVASWAELAQLCPALFPENLRDPAVYARLEREVLDFLEHEQALRRFLHDDPDYIALGHWNANIDNAWFWRDAGGEMQCGLLDWGMVRQMNHGFSLWGGLSAADIAMLTARYDHLIDLFADVLAREGGPVLDRERLGLHCDLSIALLGLALMLDAPTLARNRLPDIAKVTGPHDPLLTGEQVVHGFLHVSINFLSLWESRGFGESLRRMLAIR